MNEANAVLALLVGIALGILIHRSGFCMHSGFRQVLRGAPSASFLAYLLALAAQVVVVNALAAGQLIRLPTVSLTWAASIAGGLTFGFGMVWAKG
jgi:uncharacterized membrane protein YedE/YeeE